MPTMPMALRVQAAPRFTRHALVLPGSSGLRLEERSIDTPRARGLSRNDSSFYHASAHAEETSPLPNEEYVPGGSACTLPNAHQSGPARASPLRGDPRECWTDQHAHPLRGNVDRNQRPLPLWRQQR